MSGRAEEVRHVAELVDRARIGMLTTMTFPQCWSAPKMASPFPRRLIERATGSRRPVRQGRHRASLIESTGE
jgi:hypothetical protein